MRLIAARFTIPGTLVDAQPYGTGHINDTYAVTMEAGSRRTRYIFQRINTRIFTNVDALMTNISRVTAHVRSKLSAIPGADLERGTLTVIPTRDGAPYHLTPTGENWRCYLFIEGARTYDVLTKPRQAYEAARAFGMFQRMLADLPAPPLHDIIPFFHHTPRRFQKLEEALAADVRKRAGTCGVEMAFCREREPLTHTVVRDLESGAIPWRVTHNDTKINNVMLDDQTGAGIAVIDLDSVMPGSILYDFGDEMRTSIGHFAENERDLSKVFVDLEYFDQLVGGYLSATRDTLTKREIELLCFSGILITFTIGIRFLTDYLQGDVYFRTHREGENLDRARTQFALVRSIEDNRDTMEAMVQKHLRG
ncbi:MAG: aminoglycoside phosphotransferase family protein [Lentisphaerae bacterium]|nr:aminoglycoside phosphotransferase family protein [Lentisphaerota bacterium]